MQDDVAEVKVECADHRDVPAGMCVREVQAGKLVVYQLQADL